MCYCHVKKLFKQFRRMTSLKECQLTHSLAVCFFFGHVVENALEMCRVEVGYSSPISPHLATIPINSSQLSLNNDKEWNNKMVYKCVHITMHADLRLTNFHIIKIRPSDTIVNKFSFILS
jgi:hypothetical protein